MLGKNLTSNKGISHSANNPKDPFLISYLFYLQDISTGRVNLSSLLPENIKINDDSIEYF